MQDLFSNHSNKVKALEYLAGRSTRQHFKDFALAFFNLSFLEAQGALLLAFQRYFLVGNYAKGGYFDKLNIQWRPNEKQT